jgi:rRNA maturation protein Nop10
LSNINKNIRLLADASGRLMPLSQRCKIGLTASLMLCLTIGLILNGGTTIGRPGPTPKDTGLEDLTRVDIPSQRRIAWRPRFIMPQDTLESLYGNDWIWVARFNRVDRRHAYPGVTIKEPVQLSDVRTYAPLPQVYEPAKRYGKYLLTAKDSSNPDYSLLHFSYQKKGKEHASINIHLFKYSDTVRSVAGAVNAWTRYTGLSVETRAARLEHVKKLNAKEKDIVKAFKKLGFDPKGPRYSGKY